MLSNARIHRSVVRSLTRSRATAACGRPLSRTQQQYRLVHSPCTATPAFLPALPVSKTLRRAVCHDGLRFHTTSAVSSEAAASSQDGETKGREETPAYEMTFTCKVCQTRSTHRVSKQGYHHGTVLIQCPGCKNRHLIADHLKIFSDTNITLEDIMKEKGQLVKRGTLDVDGDLELWDDGTSTPREESDSSGLPSQEAPGPKT